MYRPEDITPVYFGFLRLHISEFFTNDKMDYHLELRDVDSYEQKQITFHFNKVTHNISFAGTEEVVHFVMRTYAPHGFSRELDKACVDAINLVESWKRRLYKSYFGQQGVSEKPANIPKSAGSIETILEVPFVMPGQRMPERNLELEREVFMLTFPCFIQPANKIASKLLRHRST
jgi:hypothetical protein